MATVDIDGAGQLTGSGRESHWYASSVISIERKNVGRNKEEISYIQLRSGFPPKHPLEAFISEKKVIVEVSGDVRLRSFLKKRRGLCIIFL